MTRGRFEVLKKQILPMLRGGPKLFNQLASKVNCQIGELRRFMIMLKEHKLACNTTLPPYPADPAMRKRYWMIIDQAHQHAAMSTVGQPEGNAPQCSSCERLVSGSSYTLWMEGRALGQQYMINVCVDCAAAMLMLNMLEKDKEGNVWVKRSVCLPAGAPSEGSMKADVTPLV